MPWDEMGVDVVACGDVDGEVPATDCGADVVGDDGERCNVGDVGKTGAGPGLETGRVDGKLGATADVGEDGLDCVDGTLAEVGDDAGVCVLGMATAGDGDEDELGTDTPVGDEGGIDAAVGLEPSGAAL